MEYKDYYKVMGVARDASQDDIKRAYRRLARKYHPDVSKESDAEARFKEVGEAYEVLSDPEKRAAYDTLGPDWQAGQQFRPPPDWQQHFHRGGGRETHGFAGTADFSDFFESLFGGGGFHRARGGFRAAGEDLRVNVPLSLEEAFRGTTRELSLRQPDSDGGARSRTLRVKIPAGVTDGQRIRLPGQGGAGIGGGPAGDLYAIVQIEPHPHFRFEGRDIYVDLPVAPWEAALGATVKVPTLGGTVDLKIPRGSGAGQRLRLKGRGLPGQPPGDQFVTLQVIAPPADSEELESLYRRMAELSKANPRARLGV
jgi:curved DNA-binding protein